jgi:hypothetical protein
MFSVIRPQAELGYKPIKILIDFAPSAHNAYEDYAAIHGRTCKFIIIVQPIHTVNILVNQAIIDYKLESG